MKLLSLALGAFIVAAPLSVSAHSGGTDRNGCHVNRQTGDRHCHRPRTGGSTSTPRALAGQGGSGAFANCAAARAAGAAPVRRGDRGYGRHLDRDNEGVGCE